MAKLAAAGGMSWGTLGLILSGSVIVLYFGSFIGYKVYRQKKFGDEVESYVPNKSFWMACWEAEKVIVDVTKC